MSVLNNLLKGIWGGVCITLLLMLIKNLTSPLNFAAAGVLAGLLLLLGLPWWLIKHRKKTSITPRKESL